MFGCACEWVYNDIFIPITIINIILYTFISIKVSLFMYIQ